MKATRSPRPIARLTPRSPADPSAKCLRTSVSSYIGLLQETGGDGRLLGAAPVRVDRLDVLLRVVQIEEPPMLRVVVVERQKRRGDLFLEALVEITANRPHVVDVRRRRVEDVALRA